MARRKVFGRCLRVVRWTDPLRDLWRVWRGVDAKLTAMVERASS